MKIKENVTVYQCDFCKKKLFSRSSMVKHEKFCSQNPQNFKACSGCIHLEEIKIKYTRYNVEFGAMIPFTANGFYCKALDKRIYPTKAEKLGLPAKHPQTFADQIPMPKECNRKDDGLGWLTEL